VREVEAPKTFSPRGVQRMDLGCTIESSHSLEFEKKSGC